MEGLTSQKRQTKPWRTRAQGTEETPEGCRIGECDIKKGGGHLFQGRLKKYEFIKSHMDLFSVEKMCRIINTSSSSFYKWISRPKSNRDKKTEELSMLVKQVHQNIGEIYGSPRIALELNKKKHRVSRSYVGRLMSKLNIRRRVRKKFKVTTEPATAFPLPRTFLGGISVLMAYRWNGLVTLPMSKLGQAGYILLRLWILPTEKL